MAEAGSVVQSRREGQARQLPFHRLELFNLYRWSALMQDPSAADTAGQPALFADLGVDTAGPGRLPPDESSETTVPVAVNVRSVSLAVLAVLATIFMLRWASAVLIPLILGLVISYALTPVVDWLARHRIPRLLAACLVMFGIVGGLGASVYHLADDAVELVEALPQAAVKLRNVMWQSAQT